MPGVVGGQQRAAGQMLLNLLKRVGPKLLAPTVNTDLHDELSADFRPRSDAASYTVPLHRQCTFRSLALVFSVGDEVYLQNRPFPFLHVEEVWSVELQ